MFEWARARRHGTEGVIPIVKAGVTSRAGTIRKRPGVSGPGRQRSPRWTESDRPGDTLLRPSAPIEPRVRSSRPIRTYYRYILDETSVNLNKTGCYYKYFRVNMNWIAFLIVTVLVNKSKAQDIFETGELIVFVFVF